MSYSDKPKGKKPAANKKKLVDKEKKDNRDAKGRFVPGMSGNPKGKIPGERTLTEVLRETANANKEEITQTLLKLALGDGKKQYPYFPALKYLYDRIDGEPVKTIEANIDGETMNVLVVKSKEKATDAE
jgi:hypothetical protein